MHVALVAGSAWVEEEAAMFRLLVAGLVNEEMTVTQVVPDSLPDEQLSAVAPRVAWRDSSWAWLRGRRLFHLAQRLAELEVDFIHALDGAVWEGAARLAAKLGAPAAFTAAAAGDVDDADALVKPIAGQRAAFTAPTRPIREALSRKLGARVPVSLIHYAVRPEPETAGVESHEAFCAAVCGDGVFDADFAALFEALRSVAGDHPRAQFFLDAGGADQHALWQAAQRLELLPNLNLVPRRVGRDDLLLRADLLIQPQASGRCRGLTLQAMARGVPILARRDDWLDYLQHDQTAWLENEPDAAAWEAAIRRVIAEPGKAKALGERARQWVMPRYPLEKMVEDTMAMYRTVAVEPLKFSGAAGAR